MTGEGFKLWKQQVLGHWRPYRQLVGFDTIEDLNNSVDFELCHREFNKICDENNLPLWPEEAFARLADADGFWAEKTSLMGKYGADFPDLLFRWYWNHGGRELQLHPVVDMDAVSGGTFFGGSSASGADRATPDRSRSQRGTGGGGRGRGQTARSPPARR